MYDVLIVGGGFAGVWAAAAAARVREESDGGQLSVAVVAPGDDLVIRPRLYEEGPGQMKVPLARVLEPIGVERVRARVTAVDTDAHRVTAVDAAGRTRTLDYRRLVLATGSQVRRPDLPGAEYLHDVDTMEGALALERHLHALPEGPGRLTAVVVGAGFTGLEVATELVGRLRARAGDLDSQARGSRADAVRVVLVERAEVVGPDIGERPRAAIAAALEEVGVEVLLGHSITSVSPTGVRLDDGTEIEAATVIWTGGMQASPLAGQIPGSHDRLGRVEVSEQLQAPESPGVFVAGDTAAAALDAGRSVVQSCQYATQLGKHAGHNAAADLLGRPLASFAAIPYVTCLDLGAAGAIFTTGFEREVQLSGSEGKERKRLINQQWIYPPLDDRETILAAADHAYSRR